MADQDKQPTKAERDAANIRIALILGGLVAVLYVGYIVLHVMK